MAQEEPPEVMNSSAAMPVSLARALDRVRRRHLVLRLAEFPTMVVAVISTAWLLQGVADRLLHLPWGLRVGLLVVDALLVCWLLRQHVFLPWRARLDRRRAALFVERAMPEFGSALISSVQLGSGDCPPESRLLVEQLLAETTAQIGDKDLGREVVSTERLKARLLGMALPLAAALLAFLLARPSSALVLRRILLSQEAYPARTQVLAETGDLEVTEGGSLVLKARARGVMPPNGNLIVTRLGKEAERIPVALAAELFTREVANIREPFSYRFELNDGVGEEHQVKVRYLPALREVSFTQAYPVYTGLPDTVVPPTAIKLLEGGALLIKGSATKPLKDGYVAWNSGERFPIVAEGEGFEAAFPVPGSGLKSFTLHLRATDGEVSAEQSPYRVELVVDKPPSITLSKPLEENLTAVMNAKLPLHFEARDDFGLASVALLYRISRPLANGELRDSETGKFEFGTPGKPVLQGDFVWDLGKLTPPLPTGGSVTFWLEVQDNNGISGPVVARSTTRTVRIVTEEEKRLELLELLSAKAAELEQLYQQQRALNRDTEESLR